MRLFSFLFLFTLSGLSAQQIVPLNHSAWSFKKAKDTEWLPATVPGTVHTDLLANKKIEEPFYRTNEKDLQWIETTDWEYKTTLSVSNNLLQEEHVELVFEGLDTYADVFLNEQKIITANNMFLLWKADVKQWLHQGNNQLRIYFHSPINKVLPQYDSLGYVVPVSNNDQGTKRVSVYTRKAGYHYGWDWGPRFVTSGIWRPAYLKAWSDLELEDVFIKQLNIGDKTVQAEAQVSVNATKNEVRILQIFVDDNPKPLLSETIWLNAGANQINKRLELKNIQLWWPNGMGKQSLYRFTAKWLDQQNQVIASKTIKKGFRDIEVVQESDSAGQSFYFKINGKPLFIKGSNYIPLDNFLPRVGKERYEQLLNTAVESNMNMLRVWGGGIYENDLFYDRCDEKGILVWQDFMFACALFPPIPALKQSIYDEAVYNVKRLRNHSSIALWCGNNEIAQFMNQNYWGHTKAYFRDAADSMALQNTYRNIFHEILPAVVKAYDNDRFYWSTSANSINYATVYSGGKKSGDYHYYGVWGGKPIEEYNNNVGRFMSEYGFQAFPEFETVKQYTLPEDYNIESEVMKAHQRSKNGNAKIANYLKDNFKIPAAFEDFLFVGQLMQSEAIRIAIEAHRRNKPYCMGTLYWQINDCWPVASWSSMDYYGRWKALQYTVKKGFAPQMISIFKGENGPINIHLISDDLTPTKGKLTVRLLDFTGKTIRQFQKNIQLPTNSSGIYYTVPANDWLQNIDTTSQLVEAVFENSNTRRATRGLYFFSKPKNLQLQQPNIVISKVDDTHIKLTATTVARFVYLQLPGVTNAFEDNYVDVLPNTPTIIQLKQPLGLDAVNQIKVKSLFDTMK